MPDRDVKTILDLIYYQYAKSSPEELLTYMMVKKQKDSTTDL